ncbi:hypothetical protein [Amycolatopsis plumensis]|uniref:Uncharacterized protein n=1 Tax=Amycolatopsis plumensis TaxID=236508 RepID=A0ABV5UI78_9PSEU
MRPFDELRSTGTRQPPVPRPSGDAARFAGTPAGRLLWLQRAAGNRATANALRGTDPRVLQRLIGFEFETPWMLKGPGGTLGSDEAAVEGLAPAAARDRRESAEERKARRRWHVSPDMRPPPFKAGKWHEDFMPRREETRWAPWLRALSPVETVVHPPKYSGYGNVEFITKAVEETPEGGEEIHEIVTAIEQAVEWIGRARPADAVPLHGLLPAMPSVELGPHLREHPRRHDVVVDRTAVDLASFGGAMQMTAGVKLEQIATLVEELARRPQDGTGVRGRLITRFADDERNQWHRDGFAAALPAAKKALAGDLMFKWMATEVEQRRLVGALATFVSILSAAEHSTDGDSPGSFRPKYTSALLSRTDLGRYQTCIALIGADAFVRLALEAAGCAPDRPLFPALAPQHHPSLVKWTARDWLTAIARNGTDPIDWGQDKADPRWQPQQVGLPGERALGHVFELRALPGNLPYREWARTARDYHRYVRLINSDRLHRL